MDGHDFIPEGMTVQAPFFFSKKLFPSKRTMSLMNAGNQSLAASSDTEEEVLNGPSS